MIVSEDHGLQLGCYGDTCVRTPRLDALAQSGVLFERAYVAQAGCSPSRASILTGLYPHQHGQIGLATHNFRMFRGETPNLVGCLKQAGYRTGVIGKIHVNPESAFPYDLQDDPWETRNLADDEVHVETLERLKKTLAAWQEQTGDALRKPELLERLTSENDATLADGKYVKKRDWQYVEYLRPR